MAMSMLTGLPCPAHIADMDKVNDSVTVLIWDSQSLT